jgi:cytochrome bd-type quinol oxidase subunit 2
MPGSAGRHGANSMDFADLFQRYWWIIFPIFGMGMAVLGLADSSRRTRQMMDLMKTYAEQGKDPPPELIKALNNQMDYNNSMGSDSASRWWTPVVFTALAAAFAVATWHTKVEDYNWAFLMVTVLFSVFAVGAFLIALSSRPKR